LRNAAPCQITRTTSSLRFPQCPWLSRRRWSRDGSPLCRVFEAVQRLCCWRGRATKEQRAPHRVAAGRGYGLTGCPSNFVGPSAYIPGLSRCRANHSISRTPVETLGESACRRSLHLLPKPSSTPIRPSTAPSPTTLQPPAASRRSTQSQRTRVWLPIFPSSASLPRLSPPLTPSPRPFVDRRPLQHHRPSPRLRPDAHHHSSSTIVFRRHTRSHPLASRESVFNPAPRSFACSTHPSNSPRSLKLTLCPLTAPLDPHLCAKWKMETATMGGRPPPWAASWAIPSRSRPSLSAWLVYMYIKL
jgi:hypothetical protein